MTLKVEMITLDCEDPDELARWWAEAVDGEVTPFAPGEFVTVTRADGPILGFQRVPDPTPGKNKLHIDFTATDVEGEVKRLVGLGAHETGRHSFGEEFNWVVLADPAGNAFCIAAAG
ncbi:VOC family protein [Mycolicibacterium celeriflavum]|uniref:Glyoxalase n=1 Tax=Mycolicibacterium celeriflavum TaxID=1249101 RepID=A0A1X0BMY3_MYCCF|nr:VOC family protein [Mycolicibacterium celeriflavum]MCV7241042.1 VOC family protein [Mycolicibacterium celeriflavum]ORA44124.1 glyoxalase [Mycolicibacterium celeriflavum]BBY45663.1 glyoxalase [Mycolicibacterium celeriflavum]